MENKKVIGVAQVLQHLKDGMTRDDIAEHYGITKAECKLLFQHEDLKGKKTVKKPSFVIVADATAEIPVVEEEEVVVEETEEKVAEDAQDNSVKDATEEQEAKEEEKEEESPIETPAAKATWGD